MMSAITFFWFDAGLLSVFGKNGPKDSWHWTFHLFPSPSFWIFGIRRYWYDGPFTDIGLGPIFRLCLKQN